MADISLLGLSAQKTKETLKNAALTKTLCDILKVAKEAYHDKENSTLELSKSQLGSKINSKSKDFIPFIVKHIMNDGLKTEAQLTAAVTYVLKNVNAPLEEENFLKSCGVGVVVTPDEIEDAITAVFSKYSDRLKEERYYFNLGVILAEVRALLPWADGGYIKKEVDMRLLLTCGPKTEEDLKGTKKKRKEEPRKENASSKTVTKLAENLENKEEGAATMEELMRTRANFHKVGENYTTDGYVTTPNTKELLRKHVAAVGGKVVTRFPPEPNGVLHIGHAKAININFGYAKAHEGKCYLRFDDTNPEKEEEKFFLAIEDMVNWLGYKPCAVTHSSDNFQQLYEWAVVLIKKNLAYVCHQKVEEIRGFEVKFSPWRDRPIEESLQLFEDMKNGKFDEGEATLRMKIVLEEGKVDPIAYRIKFFPHHRTGDKWCIYPTYDYTHCLCDSIENITHSLCTKEFQSRRSSYYWLCNSLDIYCPVQWEYGRLNVNYTVVSKRKILKLINTKVVNDWDDPRLFTLTALRRRGIPAEAINSFVAKLGLTMSQMVIDPHFLDATVRDYLNTTAPRTMVVLEGLKLVIRNYAEANLPSAVSVPNFPGCETNSDSHNVAFDKVIYIESTDYRQDNAEKGFRRLTKSQSVGLKHIGIVLNVVEEKKDASGSIKEVIVEAETLTEANKPKAFIHWVANPVTAEVRLYERLFNHKNPEDPAQVPNGFLSDINENSITVLHNALIDRSVNKSKVYDRFQFERIGYFSVDPDSTPEKLVFNRTVLLKEDAGKA